jgi:hypothetical protein
VDASLKRLDAVIQELDSTGPGQGLKGLGWVHKPMLRPEPTGKKVFIPKAPGVGLGLGPKDCKASRSLKRPMVTENGPPARLGLVAGLSELVKTMGVGLGLGPKECKASGSSKRPTESEERLPVLRVLVAGSSELVDGCPRSSKYDGVVGALGSSQQQIIGASRTGASVFRCSEMEGALGSACTKSTDGLEIAETGEYEVVDCSSLETLGTYSHSAMVVSEIGSGAESSGMGRSKASPQKEEELKLTLEMGGTAGLSYEGQIGKLEEVLGQLVVEKQGRGIGGERGSHVINES